MGAGGPKSSRLAGALDTDLEPGGWQMHPKLTCRWPVLPCPGLHVWPDWQSAALVWSLLQTTNPPEHGRTTSNDWPRLVNAIESSLVPSTNNATEQVIRIFNQHYKTFCGFENIESARLYLAVFEKVYRFSPFSNDAQERIRGKCPLELAGYEVQKLPMAQLFRGLALQWPAAAFEEPVPNM